MNKDAVCQSSRLSLGLRIVGKFLAIIFVVSLAGAVMLYVVMHKFDFETQHMPTIQQALWVDVFVPAEEQDLFDDSILRFYFDSAKDWVDDKDKKIIIIKKGRMVVNGGEGVDESMEIYTDYQLRYERLELSNRLLFSAAGKKEESP